MEPETIKPCGKRGFSLLLTFTSLCEHNVKDVFLALLAGTKSRSGGTYNPILNIFVMQMVRINVPNSFMHNAKKTLDS